MIMSPATEETKKNQCKCFFLFHLFISKIFLCLVFFFVTRLDFFSISISIFFLIFRFLIIISCCCIFSLIIIIEIIFSFFLHNHHNEKINENLFLLLCFFFYFLHLFSTLNCRNREWIFVE